MGVRTPILLPWALDTGVGQRACVCACVCVCVCVREHTFVPLGEEAVASVNSETRCGGVAGGVMRAGEGSSLCHSGIKFNFIFLHIFAR